jgi:hypothetical protein
MFNRTPIESPYYHTLEQALLAARGLLASFVNDPDFSQKSALVFGTGVDVEALRGVIEELAKADFSAFSIEGSVLGNTSILPKIEIRSASEINHARGAFAGATNTIYLSEEFLEENNGNIEAIASVLIEEMGHAIDFKVNTSDTPGDEGELFSDLVRGVVVSEGELQRIKGEDDSAVVTIDGQALQIEQSTFNLGLIQGYKEFDDYVDFNDSGDIWIFSTASTGGQNDYIAIYSDFTNVDFVLEIRNSNNQFIRGSDDNDYRDNYEEVSLANLPQGTYRAVIYNKFGTNIPYPFGADYTLEINAPKSLQSDLTPYQPGDWSDKIVVSTTTGTNKNASQITSSDSLYIDWAYINQGDAVTKNAIATRLLLNNNVIDTDNWTQALQPTFYVFKNDIKINPLSAGTHTLKLEVDYLNQETEKIETNNAYSRNFSVINALQPDLTPYQLTGWSNKIVISTKTGTNTDASQFTSSDTLYVDWAYINQGNIATTKNISTRLLLDGSVISTNNWTDSVDPNVYVYVQDIKINHLTVGNHILKLEVDYLNQESETIETNNVFERTFTVAAGNIATTDLTPYKPSHWDDKIVISTEKGTYTDASKITTGDKLYIDWAYANFGQGDTKNPITTRLLIDGNVISSLQRTDSLFSNYYTWTDDIEVNPLTAGNHTIRVEVDYGNNEPETNENNNVYEKVITVTGAAQSELTPYKPENWDDKLVISTVLGTNKNATQITTQDALYIDWAYINQGQGDTNKSHKTRLLLDGVEIKNWDRTNTLRSKYFTSIEDFKINALSAGNHTLRLEVDYLNQESESDENNNTYERNFTVISPANKPDLAPHKPTGWSNNLVISTTTGTNTDASKFTTDDTLYIDWAQINQGQGATNGAYKSRLLLNGKEVQIWTQTNAINPSETAVVTDFNLGKLAAGTHKLRLEIDYENKQVESTENNNVFERTFTVDPKTPTTISSTGNNAFDLIDIDRLRVDPLYSDLDGAINGVKLGVVVVDTGLWGSHIDLVKNFQAFVDVSGNNFREITNPSLSFDKGGTGNGHGTHVAGTIGSSNPKIGVAPNVGLLGINFLDNHAQNTFSNTFKWILDNRVKYNIVAVNMSLGVDVFLQNQSQALQNFGNWVNPIKALEQAGITVVSAAGNFYAGIFDRQTGRLIEKGEKEGVGSPAIFSTLNVGAVWQDNNNRGAYLPGNDPYKLREQIAGADRLTVFSNRLDAPGNYGDTIFAPGAMVYSTLQNNKYDYYAGTSMGSPHVAGVVALMQEAALKFGKNLLAPSVITKIIHDTADTIFDGDDENDNVKNTNKTYRRINAYKAVEGVKNYFANFTSSFTPLGAFADANGTFDGSTIGVTLNGTNPVTLFGALGIDGIGTQVGNNDVDLYKFTVDSLGTITIELKPSSQSSQFVPLNDTFTFNTLSDNSPNLQDVDTFLRLFDANKQQIDFDDNSGDGNFSKLTKILAPGEYFVGVSGAGNDDYDPDIANSGKPGATGNYAISFSLTNDDPNGILSGAKDVSFGNYNTPFTIQEVLGTDNNNTFTVKLSDVDLYRVIVPDNGQLLVDIDTPYNDKFANTFLRIFDKDGKELFKNDNGLFSSDVLLEGKEVTDTTKPDLVFQGTTTFVGHTTDSFLSSAVKRGEIYYIGVSNFNNSSYDPNNFNNRPQGGQDDRYDLTIQFVNNDNNGSITQARGDITLPITNAPGAIGKDFINVGGAITEKEVGDRDIDFVKVKSPTAGILAIEAISLTTDPVKLVSRIFNPEGKSLAANDAPDKDGNSYLQFQIEANKDYFVAISGLGNSNFDPFFLGSGSAGDTGDYTLSLRVLPTTQFTALSDNGFNNGTVQSVSIGDGIFGNIGLDNDFTIGADDLDIYKFVATKTENIHVRTLTFDAFSADTFLRFFNAAGTELGFNDDENATTTGSLISANVVAGETYYIGVNGSSANARNYNPLTGADTAPGSQGSYTLTVEIADTAPSNLMFTPDKSTYTVGDTLTLTEAWVKDLNGSSDLARVDMWVQKPNGQWIDLADATSFTPWTGGNEWGGFNYSLDLSNYAPGTYTLWGQARDQSGAVSNEVTQSFQVQNSAPGNLMFSVDKSTYTAGETLTLTNAWAKDLNGSSDLARVDMWVQKPNGQWIDLNDATSFTPWSGGNDWGEFNYSLDLSNYEAGNYTLWAQASDRSGGTSNIVTKTFSLVGATVNSAPSNLMFTPDKSTYNAGETLNLTNAWSQDLNGSSDLARVDMWVQKPNGQWIDLADATSFTPWTGGNEWGGFNYSLDLRNYAPGTYTLWGQARDQSGAVSNEVTRSFQVQNTNPTELQFNLNKATYTTTDTLTLTGAWVKDLNGSDDLTRVDMWIKPASGNWIDLSDATTFTPWSGGTEWGGFNYSLSLGSYTPGSYTLWGQARDQAGAVSNEITKTFDILAGTGG